MSCANQLLERVSPRESWVYQNSCQIFHNLTGVVSHGVIPHSDINGVDADV